MRHLVFHVEPRPDPYPVGSVTRYRIGLAVSSGQPVSEALEWDDATAETVHALILAATKAERGGRREPGAGGPQYSG